MANKRLNLAENKTEKPAGSSEAGFCVYIGPTIVGVIQNGTIYPGSKKQVLASPELTLLMAKYPLGADLLIDGEKLAASRQLLKQPGNLLHNKYRQLVRLVHEQN